MKSGRMRRTLFSLGICTDSSVARGPNESLRRTAPEFSIKEISRRKAERMGILACLQYLYYDDGSRRVFFGLR